MNEIKTKYKYLDWKQIIYKYQSVKQTRLNSNAKRETIYNKRATSFVPKICSIYKRHKKYGISNDVYNNPYYNINYIPNLLKKSEKRFQETKSKFYTHRLLEHIFSGLYAHQYPVLTSESLITHILGGRGSGKTFTTCALALKKCLMEPNVKGAIVNKDEEQLKVVNFEPLLKMILDCVGEAGFKSIVKDAPTTAGARRIDFVNGSSLFFISSEAGSGAGEKFRGRELLFIIYDEFEFFNININKLLAAGSPTLRNLEVGGSRQVIFVSSANNDKKTSHVQTLDKMFYRQKEIIIQKLNEKGVPINECEELFSKVMWEGDIRVLDNYFNGNAVSVFRETPLHTVYEDNNRVSHTMVIDADFYAPHINFLEAISSDNADAWGDASSMEAMLLLMPNDDREAEMHNILVTEQSHNFWTNDMLNDIGVRINDSLINVVDKLQQNNCKTILLIDPSGTSEVNEKCQTGAVLISVDIKHGLIYLLKDYTVRGSSNVNSNSDINNIINNIKKDGLFNTYKKTDVYGVASEYSRINYIAVECNNAGLRNTNEAIRKYATNRIASDMAGNTIAMSDFLLNNKRVISITNKGNKNERFDRMASDYIKRKFVHLYFNDTDIVVKYNKVTNDFHIKEAMMEYSTDKKNRNEKIKNKKLKIDAVDALSFVYKINIDKSYKQFLEKDYEYDSKEIIDLIQGNYGQGENVITSQDY